MSTMTTNHWAFLLGSIAAAGLSTGCTDGMDSTTGLDDSAHEKPEPGYSHMPEPMPEEPVDPIEFEDAKILIEHNAADDDTGFQGFVDGEPWSHVSILGPDRERLLKVDAEGNLEMFGMTELFFETNEPPSDEVSLEEVLALMPAGDYLFEGETTDGTPIKGSAELTHMIPGAPTITFPRNDSSVPMNEVVVQWTAVTMNLSGTKEVDLVGYQVVIEQELDEDDPGHPEGFFKNKLVAFVNPDVTSVAIPQSFLVPWGNYKVEVLAIEGSGNQTIAATEFEAGNPTKEPEPKDPDPKDPEAIPTHPDNPPINPNPVFPIQCRPPIFPVSAGR